MKRLSALFSVVVVCGMMLAACQSQTAAPGAAPSEAVSQPPANAAPTEAGAAPQAGPTNAPAVAPQHAAVPGDLPGGNGMFLGDQSTVSSLNKARAFSGDRFTLGKFERPYNANTMDVYFPYLDLVSANLYQDQSWVYARVTLVGRDANNAFPGKYALEIDKNMDGRGDLLVMATKPSSTDWTTDGMQVFKDANGDVGGVNVVVSDSQAGDGYETVVFDPAAGTPTDPDVAWVRLAPSDPNSLEIAFKASLLEGDAKYMVGIWAGNDALNPALFDLNDHYTHEQAGEANADIASFYPIKGLAELDNTCRQAMGFVPTGSEPALCSQGK